MPLALFLGAVGRCVIAAGLVAGDAWVLVGAAVFGGSAPAEPDAAEPRSPRAGRGRGRLGAAGTWREVARWHAVVSTPEQPRGQAVAWGVADRRSRARAVPSTATLGALVAP